MPENVYIIASNAVPEKEAASDDVKIASDGVEVETHADVTTATLTAPSYDLAKFQLTRILQNNTMRKTITLLGTFPDVSSTDAAIVLFEKQAFRETDVQTPAPTTAPTSGAENGKGGCSKDGGALFNESLQVRTEFINNIYGSFLCIPPTELSGIKTTVVYPATEKHIEKYSVTQKFLINETPALYAQLTLPHITASQFTLDWVYNILEHKQEVERIVYEDPDPETGFVLLPDMKWDGKTVETLYLLAIVRKRGIKSLRDLNAGHLSLLRNLRERIANAVEERYGLTQAQLRMYFHYQPSFYHLHLHVNPVRGDAPGIWCEKSHMLDTVINNLELLPDYYQCTNLPFALFENDKLLAQYEKWNAVRKQPESIATTAEKQQVQASVVEIATEERADEDLPPAKRLKPATLEGEGATENNA